MKFSIYQESRIGGRKTNQDRMGYRYTRQALLMVVCDGMGGHLLGDVAAEIALQTIGAMFEREAAPAIRNPAKFLEEAFHAAHGEIHRYREINAMPEAPRTTVVACVVQDDGAVWAHAGDSRLYWLRDGAILAHTQDHSTLQRLLKQGKITAAEAATHPDRNKIFNCVGAPEEPWVEVGKRVTLQAGDTIVLCSDGFWSPLGDEAMCKVLRAKAVTQAVPELISLALARAGQHPDNVTAVGMAWEGEGAADIPLLINTWQDSRDAVTAAPRNRSDPGWKSAEALSDDEVERAIGEIRSAFRRSNTEIE
jgi:serine/threonine protein phosphatase PrpC